jgi:hypothetical protein
MGMRAKHVIAGAVALVAGVAGAVGTGLADQGKPVTITVKGEPFVQESAKQYVLTIAGENVVQPITIEGRVSGGTASPDSDYRSRPNSLTINGTAVTEAHTLTIMGIVDDEVREPDETVNVDLRSTDGSFAQQRTVTIQDDDGALDGLLCPIVPGVVNVVSPLLRKATHDATLAAIGNCR